MLNRVTHFDQKKLDVKRGMVLRAIINRKKEILLGTVQRKTVLFDSTLVNVNLTF